MTIPFNEIALNEKMQERYDYAKEKYVEDNNTAEAYEETLNESYGEVQICGMSFQSGTALKQLDEIAFRCGMSDESDHYYEMFDSDNDIEDFRDEALESLNMEDEEI